MKAPVSIALTVAALLCIGVAGSRNGPLVQARTHYHLDPGPALENAPPMMAFTTVVLSGFRGLLTDVLWLRASFLQEQGRYFEVAQLADWITALEPRSTEVWTFHAWNIAYNVSVMMSDPQDRWRWVRNGIELLRDQGVRYNPGDPGLYGELAWLLYHKVAGTTDRANATYKREWAKALSSEFPDGTADYARLAADANARQRLEDEQGLTVSIMAEVDDRYGPLDWRLAETHALYWAYRGHVQAGEQPSLSCDRMICYALTRLFRGGRLDFRPDADIYEVSPRTDLLPKLVAAYDDAMARLNNPGLAMGYANFLRSAVKGLHDEGEEATARACFDTFQSRFPSQEGAESFEACLQSTPGNDGTRPAGREETGAAPE